MNDRGNARAGHFGSYRLATRQIRHYWYPLLALTRREIRKRYANTLFGLFWTLLLPLAMMAIYLTVFGFLLRGGQTQVEAWNFAFSLLAGLLPFQAFADGLHRACTSLPEDRTLLEHEQFPAEVLAVARVLSASVAEAVGLVLLCLAVAFHGGQTGLLIITLPVAMLLRILFTVGLAWTLSILSVFVADIAEALSLITTAWLFLTPIMYSPTVLPNALAWTLAINPLYYLVELYRGIVLQGHIDWELPIIVAIWAFASAGVGVWFFSKSIGRAKDLL